MIQLKNDIPDKTGRFIVSKRLDSFRFAFHGIKMMITTQHNTWIEILLASVVIVLGIIFRITTAEWIAVVLATGFVLAAEAFNTAIEFLTDLVSPDQNTSAGVIKDISAGAVLIAAATAFITGLIVFWKYIF